MDGSHEEAQGHSGTTSALVIGVRSDVINEGIRNEWTEFRIILTHLWIRIHFASIAPATKCDHTVVSRALCS